MKNDLVGLDLEIVEIERKAKPGCQNSSSTSPRCTCPILSPSVSAD